MFNLIAKQALRLISTTSKPQVKLFTPGPLNTTPTVRQAMNYDYGSRDPDFGFIVEDIKDRLIHIAEVSPKEYACVIMQGNGSYGIESCLTTSFPKIRRRDFSKQLLIIANGSYGERMVTIAEYLKIPHKVLRYGDYETPNVTDVMNVMQEEKNISHVAIVHSETTTGILNDVQTIGDALKRSYPNIVYIVDAMSSFGAIPLDFQKSGISYLISSSNKMIQGPPGFSFVIARLNQLRQCRRNSRSLSLDLYEQWDYQVSNPGQFRFTPPTHILASFHQALLEHEKEGGVQTRGRRYFKHQRLISEEMQKLGFELYIQPMDQGCAVTTFLQPKNPKFDFTVFYNYLAERNVVIYPGKLSKSPSFRLANMGEIYEEDIHHCIELIKEAFQTMGIPLPLNE